jgi:hypothetical protein
MTLFFGYATCCANAQREELLELASVFFPTLCSHYNFPFSSGISMSLFFFKGRRDTRRGSEGVIIQFYFQPTPLLSVFKLFNSTPEILDDTPFDE